MFFSCAEMKSEMAASEPACQMAVENWNVLQMSSGRGGHC